MCGIVGYLGNKQANPILINGLRRLEYRGYDSAGIATLSKGKVNICKKQGKVAELDNACEPDEATMGIGHTRWATHGEPSELNAHPHKVGSITLVHNGIIENYNELKEQLVQKGYDFKTMTDSEVLAALIDKELKSTGSLQDALQTALRQVVGTFGIAVLNEESETEEIVVARRGSPLILGIGDGEYFVASDTSAIVGYTDRVVYLEDDQLAVITADGYDVVDIYNRSQPVDVKKLDQNQTLAEKDGFDHFLIKEIHEQPNVVADTMRGRLGDDGEVYLGGLNMSDAQLRALKSITIVGCGTAYFAGLLGKYLIEKLANIPVNVEIGSEFRYRNAAINNQNTVALLMSQSGETADTLASLKELKRRGIHTLGLVNVVGSTLAREVDGGIYLHAGPEISVASTKAYSAMVTALLMFGLKVARLKGLSSSDSQEIFEALRDLPGELKHTLDVKDQAKQIAGKLKGHEHAFYLGRSDLYPVALEGAIKLMETSYIQAQPYPTGEMKHGPIALVDEDFLSVVLLPEDELLYSKSAGNIEEIKARKGQILSVSSRPKPALSDYHLVVPKVSPWIEPLVINVALQLFAYYMAVARGNNVDQPRNLAKSVTVE